MLMTMNEMNIGDKAKVISISTSPDMIRRLNDIGLIENTYVKCMLKSPSSDPIAYLIRGAVIALRCDDLKKIIVEREDI